MKKKVVSGFAANPPDGSVEGTFCDFSHNPCQIVCVGPRAAKMRSDPKMCAVLKQMRRSLEETHRFCYLINDCLYKEANIPLIL